MTNKQEEIPIDVDRIGEFSNDLLITGYISSEERLFRTSLLLQLYGALK